ncbi:protein stoned-A-like [Daphnia carinata]|uniref:protein stoned-A-like n=1 Tax=Daphnia carinata TaxID=120202 RepID=UPI00257C8EE8|nr:protein stoned-A-like [Daphnia carinata]
MHKLSKGLKKKIKGKKGKEKEDDLFDPAILEQYRRDKAAAAAAAAAKAAASGEDCDPSAEENGSPTAANEATSSTEPGADKKDSEEWQKFKLLTSGVDTILQKTQEDLGRIKKTSYYQRNKKPETPTPVEEAKAIVATAAGKSPSANNSEPTGFKTKWIGFEEGNKFKDLNAEEAEADQTRSVAAAQSSAVAEEVVDPQLEELGQEFEEQNEEDDEEDIFNTEYVDVVTSGELKLAYVPDSPTLEVPGDDPFDTSVVEKIVGPLPVIKKKKALVSIGAAVEILTAANAADQQQKQHHQLSTANRQRVAQPPTEIQLLCCFDDNEYDQNQTVNSATATPLANHTGSSSSAQQTPHIQVPPASGEAGLKDILAEFDVIPDSSDPIDNDFVKPPKPSPVVQQKKPELIDEEDFEFEALAYESLAKQPLPQEEEEEDDPFDTSAIEKVLNKDPVVTRTPSRKPPPSRPAAPPTRPPPPPSVAAIAAIAAAIDRSSSAPARPPVPTNPTVPSLQAQDSFDALFLDESPTEKEKLTVPKLDSPSQVSGADPFDTSAIDSFGTSAIDPFDTSAIDPFDTSAVGSFDISAPGSLVANLPSVLPAATQLQVTSFVIVDDSPVNDEIDPFDTSAVEKILN